MGWGRGRDEKNKKHPCIATIKSNYLSNRILEKLILFGQAIAVRVQIRTFNPVATWTWPRIAEWLFRNDSAVSAGHLELERWAQEVGVPREGNEGNAREQQQCRMNPRPPTEVRSFPKSQRGDGDHDQTQGGEPSSDVRRGQP